MVRFGGTAVELLIEQLDDDVEIASGRGRRLGRIGDRRAVPASCALLDEDHVPLAPGRRRSGAARRRAARSIRCSPALGDRAAVRQAAIGALNSIGHPEMGARIVAMLDDANPLVASRR